jgi:SAM-dependent methyltransferase
MAAGFKDHFSAAPQAYAAFRPTYPAALFTWLAKVTKGHELVWDCGTGNGQAAVSLADHFAHVEATDASAAQISAAKPHPRITYRVARESASGLPGSSCDLVTAAQALHWFDPPAFFAEARRVLRPGGVIAAWTYGHPALEEPKAGAILQEYARLMAPWWPPERALVDSGYRSLVFPFEEIAAPPLELELHPTREELAGYLRTWSAWKRYVEQGSDPVVAVERRLAEAWPEGERRRLFWQLAMRVGSAGASLPA